MKHVKHTRIAALLLAGILMAIAMAGCGTQDKQQGQDSGGKNQQGESELFSTMKTVDLDGKEVDGSIFEENKLTLVNVWNVGCTPCVQEIPVLDQLNREYEGKGVAIKGLYYNFSDGLGDQERKEIESILSDAKAEYQQLLNSKEMLDSDPIQQIQAFPTTFFVNSKGEILDKIEGSNDYDGWKRLIEEKLKLVEDNEE